MNEPTNKPGDDPVDLWTDEELRQFAKDRLTQDKELPVINGETSDGYHTFDELYEHRIELWIALCKSIFSTIGRCVPDSDGNPVWRSKTHSDGTTIDGWFILGIYRAKGEQITYHVPMNRWDDCWFAMEPVDLVTKTERAPEFDGHTSIDVLERLKRL